MVHAHANDAAALRGLVRHELGLAESLAPEVCEATMGRTSDRVFVDPRGRGEEARDKIEPRIGLAAGDDRPADRRAGQPPEVGSHLPQDCFRLDLDEIVESTLPNVLRPHAERR